jgi:hypothetical protein
MKKSVLAIVACIGLVTLTLWGITWAQVNPKPELPKGKEPPKTAWVQMNSGTTADLRGIWGTSSSNIYAVGYDHTKAQGVILHFDSNSWSPMEGAADNLLHAVWGTDENNIYAVGYSRWIVKDQQGQDQISTDVAFLKYDGNKWQPLFKQVGPIFLHGIGGTDPTNFYAIGYTQHQGWFILNCGGPQPSVMPLAEVKHTILRGIWGKGKEVFIVGSGGVILHSDGTTCQVMTSGTTNTLQGIWGTEQNNIYAVGEEGIILHFDGTAWKPMKSNTTAFLNGIWGKSAQEIYAVGQNGTILRYDGAKWQGMTTGTTAFLQAVWGDPASGEIFVVGADGTILGYAPKRDLPRLPPPPEIMHPPEPITTVTLFQDTVIPPHGYITKTAEVNFPVGKSWSKIELSVELIAVNDAWDRIFTMSVAHAAGDVEIDRSMTDWGYSYAYQRDVTPYGGLFKGKHRVTACLSGLTCGWRLNAKLIFYPGTPPESPFEIIPLWDWATMETNPQATPPVDTSTMTKKVKIPAGCSSGAVVLFATGHSPIGAGAEEFGPQRKINIKYDGQLVDTVSPWRANPTDAHGTPYPRSGWMPKDKVDHFVIKLPELPLQSGDHEITLEIPEVQRYWIVSAALVLYKK